MKFKIIPWDLPLFQLLQSNQIAREIKENENQVLTTLYDWSEKGKLLFDYLHIKVHLAWEKKERTNIPSKEWGNSDWSDES